MACGGAGVKLGYNLYRARITKPTANCRDQQTVIPAPAPPHTHNGGTDA
jgi:hypothetical protein